MEKQIPKEDCKMVEETAKSYPKIQTPITPIDIQQLHKKIREADLEGVRTMLERWGEAFFYRIYRIDADSSTALHVAAEINNSAILQALIENLPEWMKKIALNCRDEQEETPLHKAVGSGCVDNVKILLANNVEIEKVNGQGETALFCAVTRRDFNITKLLLGKGASIDSPNWKHQTVLQSAISNGDAYYVGEILKHGAAIDAKNGRGETPLHCTIKMGKLGMVQILLDKGATVDKNHLHLAIQHGHGDVVELLLDHDIKIDFEALRMAANRGQACILDDLLRRRTEALNDQECRVLQGYSRATSIINVVLSKHQKIKK